MKLKIGVIGAGASVDPETARKSYDIGREIATAGCILLTGSSPGLPYEAVKGAKEAGGITVGFSPASNILEHVEKYNFPIEPFDILIFTGFGLKGRNIIFIRSCDGVVVISGRIGTLNEFTIAYDEGRTVGVLAGSGGITQLLPEIINKSEKKGAMVIYESDPKSLIKQLVDIIQENQKHLESKRKTFNKKDTVRRLSLPR
jgi:uncharacterized protein (TIGR00725 family)